jgi:excisionase family DNA binding protein
MVVNTVEGRWLTDREVAKKLGIARSTVWNWAKLGLLEPHKLGPRTTRFWSDKIQGG